MSGWTIASLTGCVALLLAPPASARDLRLCLTIQDVERRVECLEGREDPAQPTQETEVSRSPSFDCSRASPPIETTICADPLLRRLDSDMGIAFAEAIKTQANKSALLDSQRQWIASRNTKCGRWPDPATMRDCLQSMTAGRVSQLRTLALVPAQTPFPEAAITPHTAQPENQPGQPQAPIDRPAEPQQPQLPINRSTEPQQPAETRPSVDEETASNRQLESIKALLAGNQLENVRFVTHTVDKKELQGFSHNMPLLRVVYDERVFFDTDKDAIRREALPAVTAISTTLKKQKTKVALFVAGHTDGRGPEKYNLDLSIRRAESVAREIKKLGSGPAFIWRVGFGKALPIRPNDSERNWAYNRRVEFLIASEANVITAWISRANVCEDNTCGTTSVNSKFEVIPITDEGVKPISLQLDRPEPVQIEMVFKPFEVGPPLQ